MFEQSEILCVTNDYTKSNWNDDAMFHYTYDGTQKDLDEKIALSIKDSEQIVKLFSLPVLTKHFDFFLLSDVKSIVIKHKIPIVKFTNLNSKTDDNFLIDDYKVIQKLEEKEDSKRIDLTNPLLFATLFLAIYSLIK